MKKPAIAIIQARMSSSRLPEKVMLPLAGKPVIRHIYERAQSCRMIDKVIVATSIDESDNKLAEYCHANSMNCYRGSLNNVLSRFTDILTENEYPYFARITGDCPLIHPPFIDEQIRSLIRFNADVLWSRNESPVLEGQGVRSKRSLFHIRECSGEKDDLEHVGSLYLAEHPDEFRIVEIEVPQQYLINDFRLTIDENKDYQLFTEIFNSLYHEDTILELPDVIEWLKVHGNIAVINRRISHKPLNIEIRDIRKNWIDCTKDGFVKLNI